MNLKEKIAEKAKPVEKALEKYLRIRGPKKLYEATAHIPMAGGKRLRPVMALITCEMIGGEARNAIPFAASLEAIHNFTLVHDGVMDDDDLRHGVAACHTIYGLSTAILAGDTLFAYAFEMITDCNVSDDIKADLVQNIAYTVRLLEICLSMVDYNRPQIHWNIVYLHWICMVLYRRNIGIDDTLATLRS